MIQVIYGQTTNTQVVIQIAQAIQGLDSEGTLYIGYPALASIEETLFVEALLVSHENGVVAFDIGQYAELHGNDLVEAIRNNQDKIYFALHNNLAKYPDLRDRRDLGVKINVVTYLPALPDAAPTDLLLADPTTLLETVTSFTGVSDTYWRPLNAALQRVSTIRPGRKRETVTRRDSRGAVLKKIEKEIANLDRWQKMAAIETPDGAQRIRGLAGSGKTVVLALKAAYLHAKHPDWIIALTFHSRSLYQQTMDLVRRFSFEHSNDEPNFENLRVMHSWGSGRKAGVYSEIAGYLGATPRDYFFAKTAFGPADAFSGVCRELLNIVHNRPPEPVYDAVLIDEAQDLPREFFELVFEFTKEPKRIVWAYDELQNLTNQKVPSVEDLFGQDAANARVDLVARPNEARRDIILPVCYRNTPWALTLAHALGLGIYRRNGLIQHFDFPAFWDEVGYQVENGELAAGQNVTLVRKTDSYPSYMTDLVNAADSVSSHCFANENEQAEYVASQITINLNDDELEFSDILLVLPDARRARTQSKVIMDALERRGISSHLVGVTTSQDEVFVQNSIAITSIFRAKGNEAPMVYLVNAHDCFEGYELIRLRNTLFTALTRSKAWVRICGYGENMRLLELEIRAVIAHEFRLQFRIPTDDQLNAMNRLHRDLTDAERVEIREAERGLRKYLDAVENGTISLDNLPINVRARLLQTLKTQETEVDDVE